MRVRTLFLRSIGCIGASLPAPRASFSLLAEEAEPGTPLADEAESRALEVYDAFTAEFFDTSACRFRRDNREFDDADRADTSSPSTGYWRAVDQAIGCLACMRMAKVGHKTAMSRAMASSAADSLLREFGYSLFATEQQPPGTYLGRAPQPPRNSWHDGLACLALITSGVLGVGGETPAGLVRAMADSYRDPESKVILHSPRELRLRAAAEEPNGATDNVAFTSTQALWSAIVRAAELSSERAEAVGGADVPALRAWYEAQGEPETGLLPVANVYATPRLWANTEWAAFVLLNKDVFVATTKA